MDYTEIVDLALSYADREDKEVTDNIDNFLRIVEARVNRKLRTFEMSTRATLPLVEDQEYYGLPPDFGGLRDIEITASPDAGRQTLSYMSPEQLNNQQRLSTTGNPSRRIFYTLVAKQVQIFPPQTGTMEIIYYQKLVPLTELAPENWLSMNDPDGYVFGLMVEISSFVKDKEAAALWDGRFVNTIDEIDQEDKDNRWSGTALEIRLG